MEETAHLPKTKKASNEEIKFKVQNPDIETIHRPTERSSMTPPLSPNSMPSNTASDANAGNLIIHRIAPLDPFGTLIRVRDFIGDMSEGKVGMPWGGSCCSLIGDECSLDMPSHAFRQAAEAFLDKKDLSYRGYGREMCWWTYAVDIGGKAFSNFARSAGDGGVDVLSESMELALSSKGGANVSFAQIESKLSAMDAKCNGIISIENADPDERLAVERILKTKLREVTGKDNLVSLSCLMEDATHYVVRIFDKNIF
ncbi:hypothetical protein [Acetobacter persici]|uniref:Uncharacterized protein n=1 Tax=Acetobacter persici TaxID=1076596 RepID=A0A1U9LJ73_9PROT|nr:hypothetical protein [Acetobacter persici]AQT06505.1 hypothetical protein A0U91_15980 [Acetobacter persici]